MIWLLLAAWFLAAISAGMAPSVVAWIGSAVAGLLVVIAYPPLWLVAVGAVSAIGAGRLVRNLVDQPRSFKGTEPGASTGEEMASDG